MKTGNILPLALLSCLLASPLQAMDGMDMGHSASGAEKPSQPARKAGHDMSGMDMSDMGDMDMSGMDGMEDMYMPDKARPAAPKARSAGSRITDKKPRIVHKAVDAPSSAPVVDIGHHMHGMDAGRWFHGVLDEFEGRYQAGGKSSLRWDGEAWYGGDYNRLWLKSEGTMTKGRVRDGDQELLYSRAISTYFNLQGGVRLDLDSGPTRAWGAVGVEGLALYQFEVQATGYFSDRGVAGRFEGSYDILLTNRLILQPQVELNLYSRADPRRQVGSGLADIDTGLRLRYEVWRKMAPYVAVTYDSPLTQGRHMARKRGEKAGEARFTFGIRSWF